MRRQAARALHLTVSAAAAETDLRACLCVELENRRRRHLLFVGLVAVQYKHSTQQQRMSNSHIEYRRICTILQLKKDTNAAAAAIPF